MINYCDTLKKKSVSEFQYLHIWMMFFPSASWGFLYWLSADSVWRWSTLFRLSVCLFSATLMIWLLFELAPNESSRSRRYASSSWADPEPENPLTPHLHYFSVLLCEDLEHLSAWLNGIIRLSVGRQTDRKFELWLQPALRNSKILWPLQWTFAQQNL